MGETCWEYANGQKIYVNETFCPKGVVCPYPGAVYDHNIQASSLKLRDQSKPNFMWSNVLKGE